jgi:hypothetical protein
MQLFPLLYQLLHLKMGQCLACDGTGLLWTSCTECEDSGMVYSEIPEDSEDSDQEDKPIGTCSHYNGRGEVGLPCTTSCKDPNSIYLNFHAGL